MSLRNFVLGISRIISYIYRPPGTTIEDDTYKTAAWLIKYLSAGIRFAYLI